MRNSYEILIENQLGRPRRRWDNDIITLMKKWRRKWRNWKDSSGSG